MEVGCFGKSFRLGRGYGTASQDMDPSPRMVSLRQVPIRPELRSRHPGFRVQSLGLMP